MQNSGQLTHDELDLVQKYACKDSDGSFTCRHCYKFKSKTIVWGDLLAHINTCLAERTPDPLPDDFYRLPRFDELVSGLDDVLKPDAPTLKSVQTAT